MILSIALGRNMDSQVKSTLLVTFLMISSGCTGLLDTDTESQIPIIDCSSEPSGPDCFEKIITKKIVILMKSLWEIRVGRC